jgi:hypothetical protein
MRRLVMASSVNGPIEFIADVESDRKGPTEFGGDAGLIVLGPNGEHVPTASERRGVLVRAVGAVKVDALTGRTVDDPAGLAVDPLTGLGVEDEWNLSGSGGVKPVDVPPPTSAA